MAIRGAAPTPRPLQADQGSQMLLLGSQMDLTVDLTAWSIGGEVRGTRGGLTGRLGKWPLVEKDKMLAG